MSIMYLQQGHGAAAGERGRLQDQEVHLQCADVRAAILDGEEGQAEVGEGQAGASGGPNQRDGGGGL